MLLTISLAAEAAERTESISPFIPAGIAFGFLLFVGVVTWSYRDVANRTSKGESASHDSHGAGH